MSWLEAMAYLPGIAKGFTVDALKERNLEATGQLELFPLQGMIARIRSDKSPHPHRNGNLYSVGYLVGWGEEDDKNSDLYKDWIRRVHEYMSPFVSKGPRAAYVNEVDLDLGVMDWDNHSISSDEYVNLGRAWGERYFLGNYNRLVRAKTYIDPNNVFRHRQSIPPMFFQDLNDDSNQFVSC
ncbi:hypothetical protein IFM89_016040 [Coptis chinensis]|uniref:Berberine/berberine-like domain-containing protein n=1 Tax=Coptis chinensis TaxID=261450 RepID=A0A835H454_9MAGN|nr:hypothetical protein IFM89_016040 [Coptis chinensis]